VDLTAVAALLRRVLGSSPKPAFERTADGVSAQVYRVSGGSETFAHRRRRLEELIKARR
jgi:hypothetical protein